MKVLHRAVVSIGRQPEQHIFFLARSGSSAGSDLAHLVDQVCGVPSHRIDFYNVHDEGELLRMGEEGSGDARLFESGFDQGRPTYLDPRKALFWVDPGTAERLHQAARLIQTTAPCLS